MQGYQTAAGSVGTDLNPCQAPSKAWLLHNNNMYLHEQHLILQHRLQECAVEA